MKNKLLSKTFLALIIFTLFITLCSCGFLFNGNDDDLDSFSDTSTDTPPNQDSNVSTDSNTDTESETDTLTYTITTNCSTDDYGLAGTYTMLKDKEYNAGDKVELTATVNDGYNFEGWFVEEKTGSGYYAQTNYVLLSENTSYTYTMQSRSITIVAQFSSYTVTTLSDTNIGGAAGSFTRLNGKKISDGETVALTATVNDGYNFEGWYIDGVCVSRNLDYNYLMEKKNINIDVRYSCYQLSTTGLAKNSAEKNEAGFHAGTYTTFLNYNVSVGKSVNLTATVNDGYNFVGWYIDGVCVATDLEYTYVMNRKDVTIIAVYVYYTLTTTVEYGSLGPGCTTDDLSASAGQYISPVYTKQKVSVGTEISLTAKDITGWKFIGWMSGDGGVLSYDKSFTFEMRTGDLYVYALYYNEKYV